MDISILSLISIYTYICNIYIYIYIYTYHRSSGKRIHYVKKTIVFGLNVKLTILEPNIYICSISAIEEVYDNEVGKFGQ